MVADLSALGVMWESLNAKYPIGSLQLTGQVVIPAGLLQEGGVEPYGDIMTGGIKLLRGRCCS